MGRSTYTNQEHEFLFYINSLHTARLLHDHKAWILEKRHPSWIGRDNDGGYHVVGIVQSNKDLLLQRIRDNEILVCPSGRRMLAALDDDYWRFHEDLLRLGREQKLIAMQQAAMRTAPVPQRQVIHDRLRQRRIELWHQARLGGARKLKTGKE